MRLAWIVALAAGCQQDSVLVRGVVFDGHESDAPPLPGAAVTFVDPNGGTVLDEVTSEFDGAFRANVPPGLSIVAEIRGPGLATSTFPGSSGFNAVLDVEDHTFYGVEAATVEAVRARFAGCPGADANGAVAFGEVRIFGLQDPITGENPTTNSARVDVISRKGDTWAGCYLNDEGTAHDPSADRTGSTGLFAVFGVRPGLHEVDVRYEFAPDYWIGELYPTWVPQKDEQVVLPMWPAWVQWQL